MQKQCNLSSFNANDIVVAHSVLFHWSANFQNPIDLGLLEPSSAWSSSIWDTVRGLSFTPCQFNKAFCSFYATKRLSHNDSNSTIILMNLSHSLSNCGFTLSCPHQSCAYLRHFCSPHRHVARFVCVYHQLLYSVRQLNGLLASTRLSHLILLHVLIFPYQSLFTYA